MVDWLSYSNQGATRSQPISDDLVQAMAFLDDLGVSMDVYSGGQPSAGNGARVGSTRHDHGNAADVMFSKDGRMLDWNTPGDVALLSDIVARARENGVTGIGAGNDYMGPGRIHIGFGAPAVWGAGGKAGNAPDWLKAAYYGARPANPAVNAISAATAQQPVMRPAQGGNPWGNPLGAVMKAAQAMVPPKVTQGIANGMLGSVAGRTAIMRALMPSNIGKAPAAVAGFVPGGTQVTAVSKAGTAPMTLVPGGNEGSKAYDKAVHAGQNMDVYRANKEAIGGNITKASIERALSGGGTLYKK